MVRTHISNSYHVNSSGNVDWILELSGAVSWISPTTPRTPAFPGSLYNVDQNTSSWLMIVEVNPLSPAVAIWLQL